MRQLIIIAILSILSSSLTTRSADLTASHAAAIEKLLKVMDVEKVMAKSLENGLKAGFGVSEEQIKFMPKEQQDKFNSAMEKVMTALMAEMSWEKIKPAFVEAYGKNFSEKEALDIATMMESPTGKLYVSKQGEIAVAIAKITQERMKNLTPRIMQIMQAEMRK